MKLGGQTVLNVPVISTGSLSIDAALGIGGLPRGRVIEVYGPESSGKTTIALHAIAECQKEGGTAAFIDAEHAMDAVYAGNLSYNASTGTFSQFVREALTSCSMTTDPSSQRLYDASGK